jgi:hypothetical protein
MQIQRVQGPCRRSGNPAGESSGVDGLNRYSRFGWRANPSRSDCRTSSGPNWPKCVTVCMVVIRPSDRLARGAGLFRACSTAKADSAHHWTFPFFIQGCNLPGEPGGLRGDEPAFVNHSTRPHGPSAMCKAGEHLSGAYLASRLISLEHASCHPGEDFRFNPRKSSFRQFHAGWKTPFPLEPPALSAR